jgi:hypothetical protein
MFIKNKKSGFSFIEICFAMVLFFLIVMFFVSLYPGLRKMSKRSKEKTIGVSLCQAKLSEFLAGQEAIDYDKVNAPEWNPNNPVRSGNFAYLNEPEIYWEYFMYPVNFTPNFKELKIIVYRLLPSQTPGGGPIRINDSAMTYLIPQVVIIKDIIAIWSGTYDTIPRSEGWEICDGTKYGNIQTPDLRGKFILCAGESTEFGHRPHIPGSTGGATTVRLTENQNGAHRHLHREYYPYLSYCPGIGVSGLWVHKLPSTNTGGGNAHNNIPPYYALYYIMKVR